MSSIGVFIDAEAEEVKEYLKDKNVGILCSLRNYVQLSYTSLVKVKEDAKQRLKECSEEDKKVLEDLIKGTYVEMLKCEQKVVLLDSLIKERNVDK